MRRRLLAAGAPQAALLAVVLVAGPCAARATTPRPRPEKKTGKRVSRSSTVPRTPTDPTTPHERRVTELRAALEAVLREPPLSRARVGVVAMQAGDGDVLFSHDADARFNPASNTKILTTAAAIDRLGGEYRYRTALYGAPPDGDGAVGTVTLRGSSDPSLSSTDLAELARELADRGVTEIHGDLVVDRRPIGWEGVGGDGLILNRNTIGVRVRPGAPKRPPALAVEPAGAGISVENRAVTTTGRKTRLKLDSYRREDHLVVQLKGRIGEDRGPVLLGLRVADGALLCGHTLAAVLADFGITLRGRVRAGDELPPFDGREHVLAVHRSAALADISRISNKPSNNFVADAIYKTLGAELFGLPGTLEKGTRAVGAWLVERGIDPARFRLVNGSGLTHENRITPIDLARLLRAIYFEPALAPDFLPSLAVAGIDGTIRNRFLGTSAVGLVRGKTGTLSGVSALSGYVGDKGDVLVFSILVEGFRNRSTHAVRHAQVRLVEAMLRYLRAEAGPAETPRVSPEERGPTLPGDENDSETDDGDPTP